MPRLPRKVARRHRRPSPAQGRHPVPSVPCLPRKTAFDVSLCHACGCQVVPRLPRKVAQRHRRPIPAQGRHPVPSVPRLPRKTTVDVTLCHACHVKRRWMSGCATPATQSGAASQAPNPGPRAPPSVICPTPATQNDGRCDFVPRLPRETTVDVRLCHACHAKWRLCVCVCVCEVIVC